MKTAAKYIAAFVLLASLSFALVCVGLAALSIRQAAKDTSALVQETNKRVVYTSQNINAILLQAGLAADEARLASAEQRRYLKTLNSKLNVLLDQSANTLQQMQITIASIDKNSTVTFESLRLALEEMKGSISAVKPLLQEATNTTASLNKVVSDPNIPKTLDHVEKTTDNLRESSVNVNRKIKEITKPANWAKEVGITALKIAVGLKQLLF